MEVTSAALGLEAIRLASSIVYGVVAWLVLQRSVDAHARLAQHGFMAWWIGIALLGLISVPSGFGWNSAAQGLGIWRVYVYSIFALVFVALAGLVYYLLYLYTGRRRVWRAVVAFYVLMSGYLVYLIEAFGPYVGVEDSAPAILFERTQPELASLAFSIGLSLPPLAAAIAYFALYFRLPGRESRYRILLVSTGLGGWFLYSVLGTVFRFVTGTEQTYAGSVVAQLVGLAAAVLVLVAFVPPRPVRKWFAAGREAIA